MVKRFDVVIGNPPYQEESTGEATHNMPIYHQFMSAAYEMGTKAVLITPARFLFNAGYTPKAWNEKMLSDPHLSVPHYVPNSDALFPGTDIKGGIAVTYRDADVVGTPIEVFTRHPEVNTAVHRVRGATRESLASSITSSRSFRYTDLMHAEHPEAVSLMASGEQYKVNTRTFEQLAFLYSKDEPAASESYTQVLGLIANKRHRRWIKSAYISGPGNFLKFKIAVPAANGSGQFGEALSSPVILGPNEAATQTFLTIGAFSTRADAEACLKYVKSKFARAMLGVLKITQHNPAKVWKYVPVQDFTSSSDIDWSKSIAEIDKQLYAKYGFDDDEIAFIELNVKPME